MSAKDPPGRCARTHEDRLHRLRVIRKEVARDGIFGRLMVVTIGAKRAVAVSLSRIERTIGDNDELSILTVTMMLWFTRSLMLDFVVWEESRLRENLSNRQSLYCLL